MIKETFGFLNLSDWESIHETQELPLKQFVCDDMLMERIASYERECPTFGENWKCEDLFERRLLSQEKFIRQERSTPKETLTVEIDHRYNKPEKFVPLHSIEENIYNNHKSDKKNFSKNQNDLIFALSFVILASFYCTGLCGGHVSLNTPTHLYCLELSQERRDHFTINITAGGNFLTHTDAMLLSLLSQGGIILFAQCCGLCSH